MRIASGKNRRRRRRIYRVSANQQRIAIAVSPNTPHSVTQSCSFRAGDARVRVCARAGRSRGRLRRLRCSSDAAIRLSYSQPRGGRSAWRRKQVLDRAELVSLDQGRSIRRSPCADRRLRGHCRTRNAIHPRTVTSGARYCGAQAFSHASARTHSVAVQQKGAGRGDVFRLSQGLDPALT